MCPTLTAISPSRDSKRSEGEPELGALCTCWGCVPTVSLSQETQRPALQTPVRMCTGEPCQAGPGWPEQRGPATHSQAHHREGRAGRGAAHTPSVRTHLRPPGRAHAPAGARAHAGTCTRHTLPSAAPEARTPPRGHPAARPPRCTRRRSQSRVARPSCGEGVPAKAVWASPGGGSRRALGSASPLKHPPAEEADVGAARPMAAACLGDLET